MARAAALRLRSALEEYIAENKGDNPRSRARGVDAELVKQAESLLGGMGSTTAPGADTPGRRSAGGSPGRAIDSASQRARELLGVSGAAATDGGEQ